MKHYIDNIISTSGGPLQGVVVTVVDPTSGNMISIYSDNSGTPIVGNSVTSDDQGNFDFYVLNGTYNVEYRYGGALLKVLHNVDMYDGNVTAEAQTLQNEAAASAAVALAAATGLSTAAASAALSAAAAAASAAGNLFDSTAHALSNGVINTATLVGGTGGTNGSFSVAFSGGGGTGAAATFVVAGGIVTQITITSKGVGYTSAPTISFAASSGLSGASATAVIGPRTSPGDYFFVAGTGNSFAELWRNVAGTATDQNIAIPSQAALTPLTAMVATIKTVAGGLNTSGSSVEIADPAGKVMLALNANGILDQRRASAYLASVAAGIGLDTTAAAIRRLPRVTRLANAASLWGITVPGQSLASGFNEGPLTTTQPFANVRVNPGNTAFVPAVAALAPGASTIYETVESPAVNSFTARLMDRIGPWTARPFDWVVNNMGSGNTAYAGLAPGTSVYNGGLAKISAAHTLAVAAGKTYAERAVAWLHGENDATAGMAAATYAADVIAYKNQWNIDVAAITGQTDRIPMFILQKAVSNGPGGQISTTIGEQIAAETDSEVFIIVPDYAMDFYDGLHLNAQSEQWGGEYMAKALWLYCVEGRSPSTVRPLSYTVLNPNQIEAKFYVPVPPLVLDLESVWQVDDGLGWTFADNGSGTAAPLARPPVPVAADTILFDFTSALPSSIRINYALDLGTVGITGGGGAGRTCGARGNLRDCDRTPSYYTDSTGTPYPLFNWCAAHQKVL